MSHSFSIRAGLSLLSLLVAACVAAADGVVEVAPPARTASISDPAHAPFDPLTVSWSTIAISPRLFYAVADLVAWTEDGGLAVVDGRTGAPRAAVATLGLAGERDLVYDADAERLWVAEADDGGAGGEIASYPVVAGAGGAVLGPRVHEASLSGSARLLATPLGALAFEHTAGVWRLLSGDGAAGAPVPAPRPMSAWVTTEATGTTVHALAYGPSSGELDAVTAPVGAGAIGPVVSAAFGADAGSVPPSARLVPAPDRGGALLLDIGGSFLTVRAASGTSEGAPALTPLGATGLRLEAAVSLAGGAVVVALISGSSQVVALAIDPDLAVASVAKVQLPGKPAASTHVLGHDLVVQGVGRVAAVTSAGVFSIEVWQSPIGVQLAIDPGFAGAGLRGPIAPLWPAPR